MSDNNEKKCGSGSDSPCTRKICCDMPNARIIRGALMCFFGLILVGFAYSIIIRAMFFGVGVVCIYHGLRGLGVTQVTNYVDCMMGRIKKYFDH